jgi:hypothetical protein
MLLLQHQQQQQQQHMGLLPGSMAGMVPLAGTAVAVAAAAATVGAQGVARTPYPPAGTPATAYAAAAGSKQAAVTSDLLAAAAVNLAADSARVSVSGTPSGIASSIAQMTLQSPAQFADAASARPSSPSIFAGPAAVPQAGQDNCPQQQQQQQQQQQELPWQHLPANACNGVAVFNGDSGLVLITGQTVTTGLIKPAAQRSGRNDLMSVSNGSRGNSYIGSAAAADGIMLASAAAPVPAGQGYMMSRHSTGPQSPAVWDLGGQIAGQYTGATAACGSSAAAAAAAGGDAGMTAYNAAAAAVAIGARRLSAPQISYAGAGCGLSSLPAAAAAGPAPGPGFMPLGFAPPPAATAAAGYRSAAGPAAAGAIGVATLPAQHELPTAGVAGTGVVIGSNPAGVVGPGGFFQGFGDFDAMQEDLSSQQLQDLLAGSALLRRPGSDVFGSFICQ